MAFEPFRPSNDLILVRRHVEDNSTDRAGFIIPEKFREQSNKGIVLSFGEFVSTSLKAGDRITFGVHNSEIFVQDGEELLLIRDADIRGVETFVDDDAS